jgi:hypothetical protein
MISALKAVQQSCELPKKFNMLHQLQSSALNSRYYALARYIAISHLLNGLITGCQEKTAPAERLGLLLPLLGLLIMLLTLIMLLPPPMLLIMLLGLLPPPMLIMLLLLPMLLIMLPGLLLLLLPLLLLPLPLLLMLMMLPPMLMLASSLTW